MSETHPEAHSDEVAPPWARAWPWLAAAALAVAAVALHRDFGVTWDEVAQATYGELVRDYFASGGADTRCNDYLNLRFYGPAVELLAALVYDGHPAWRFEARHLVVGLVAACAAPALALLGKRSGDWRVGVLAVPALIALPRFVGHAWNNSKDLPFAVAVVWFMLASAAWWWRSERRWPQALACALALGAALSARPGGWPLLGAYFLAAGALAAYLRGGPRPSWPPARATLATWATIPVGGWLLLVAGWPWAHAKPAVHPIAAALLASRFGDTFSMLYMGQVVASDALPWHYLPAYVLITTPLSVCVLAGAGVVVGVRRLGRRQADAGTFVAGLALVWLLLPLALFVILRPNLYDGLRHMLFVLPALALLAGIGGAALIRRAPARRRPWVVVCVGLLLALPLREQVTLHPYQATYFNGLVGGVAGAQGRFETDYWAASYAEALRWIDARAAADPERELRVLIDGTEFVRVGAAQGRPANVRLLCTQAGVPDAERVDYYVQGVRTGWAGTGFPDAPSVHTVERGGAVFATVRAPRRAR